MRRKRVRSWSSTIFSWFRRQRPECTEAKSLLYYGLNRSVNKYAVLLLGFLYNYQHSNEPLSNVMKLSDFISLMRQITEKLKILKKHTSSVSHENNNTVNVCTRSWRWVCLTNNIIPFEFLEQFCFFRASIVPVLPYLRTRDIGEQFFLYYSLTTTFVRMPHPLLL